MHDQPASAVPMSTLPSPSWGEVATESPAVESPSSAASLSPAATPGKVYHHCRRLRRTRDKVLERPACLACLVFTVTLVGVFLVAESWWWYTRRWPGLPEQAVAKAPKVVQQRFAQLGCYPLVDEDSVTTDTDLYDYKCMQQIEGYTCRSGLPFYTFKVEGQHAVSWRMCAEFCVMKGFDVSGVVDGVVCRCGASDENRDIWRGGGRNRTDLSWQLPKAVVASEDPRCRIVAARYVGPMPIPKRDLDLNDRDLAYVEGVMLGRKIDLLADSHQPSEHAILLDLGPQNSSFEQEFIQAWLRESSGEDPPVVRKMMDNSLRSCYPHQCAAGLPWPIKTTYLTGIPYAFDDMVPQSTRAAFRAAIMAYHAATCIVFNEVSTSYTAEFKIYVKDDEDGCFTTPVGYPLLYRQDTEINLGWCNTERQIGNMIHELGHALGMAHEHMRPDRDNFVKIATEGMSDLMQAQYAKDDQSYVGSMENGFAPYDYGSLMHYPATWAMRTLPLANGVGVHDAETGQRRQFSALDVKQLRDMYQCDVRTYDDCTDMNDELGATIKLGGQPATCDRVQKYCKHPKFGKEITYFCPRSCNNCPKGLPHATSHAAVKGCTDVNQFCARYKDYCPKGHLVGQEQWMAENCRKTCNIARYCGGRDIDMEHPSEIDQEASNAWSACIDSQDTGLLNALGQAESCAGLRDRCHDVDVGSQVRAACPATCGLCMTVSSVAGQAGADPMPQNETLVISLSLTGSGYDLAEEAQEKQFQTVFGMVVRDIFRDDLTVSVSRSRSCDSPCFSGRAEVTGRCCNALVEGCSIECEELIRMFSRDNAEELTKRFAGQGLAGVVVEDLAMPIGSVDHVFTVIFTAEWLIRIMLCVGVSALVCLLFAITRARCFKGRSKRRRTLRHLGSDLLDSDDESAEEA